MKPVLKYDTHFFFYHFSECWLTKKRLHNSLRVSQSETLPSARLSYFKKDIL